MMKNAFCFILKALYLLKRFKFLSWLFGRVRENNLIRKIRLTSEFMTSRPGYQTIATHILANISRRNQTMKLVQLIEYNKINIFLQKLYGKWSREASSRPLFVFWKSLIWGKSKCSAAYFLYISIALNLAYNKNKLHETLDHWVKDMLSFNFSEKGLGLVSPPHFAYDISRKMFLMLHFIDWPNFIVWLFLLLEILDNMCITIVC